MADMNLTEMQAMQMVLQERHREKWGGLSPEMAREKLLWMLIEAGEAADVIKKNGDCEILHNADVRHHFIEELCDVLMYFQDVALCYGISPDELSAVYREKHNRNMERW